MRCNLSFDAHACICFFLFLSPVFPHTYICTKFSVTSTLYSLGFRASAVLANASARTLPWRQYSRATLALFLSGSSLGSARVFTAATAKRKKKSRCDRACKLSVYFSDTRFITFLSWNFFFYSWLFTIRKLVHPVIRINNVFSFRRDRKPGPRMRI